MALQHSPSIVTSGLSLCLDAANPRSYPGSGIAWNDVSGNVNNGTLVNGPTYSSANLGSIVFDGVNDYVSVPGITDTMLNSNSWSLSSWAKFAAVNKGSDNAIAGAGAAGVNLGLHLSERTSYVYFGFYGNDLGGTIALSAGNWYNIVYTFNYTTKLKTIYVNGVYDNSGGTVGYSGTGSNFSLGYYPWAATHLLNGSLATAQFYTTTLTSAEVTSNFNAQRGRYGI
jgi:hypothetical protein